MLLHPIQLLVIGPLSRFLARVDEFDDLWADAFLDEV
jgi:hypothetical protein